MQVCLHFYLIVKGTYYQLCTASLLSSYNISHRPGKEFRMQDRFCAECAKSPPLTSQRDFYLTDYVRIPWMLLDNFGACNGKLSHTFCVRFFIKPFRYILDVFVELKFYRRTFSCKCASLIRESLPYGTYYDSVRFVQAANIL